jgi:hypothetical protein
MFSSLSFRQTRITTNRVQNVTLLNEVIFLGVISIPPHDNFTSDLCNAGLHWSDTVRLNSTNFQNRPSRPQNQNFFKG